MSVHPRPTSMCPMGHTHTGSSPRCLSSCHHTLHCSPHTRSHLGGQTDGNMADWVWLSCQHSYNTWQRPTMHVVPTAIVMPFRMYTCSCHQLVDAVWMDAGHENTFDSIHETRACLPSQDSPSADSTYPGAHTQSYEPSLLLQAYLSPHSNVPRAHSSTSAHVSRKQSIIY